MVIKRWKNSKQLPKTKNIPKGYSTNQSNIPNFEMTIPEKYVIKIHMPSSSGGKSSLKNEFFSKIAENKIIDPSKNAKKMQWSSLPHINCTLSRFTNFLRATLIYHLKFLLLIYAPLICKNWRFQHYAKFWKCIASALVFQFTSKKYLHEFKT